MNKLINFIKEARKRGFDDYQIRKALLDKGWPESIVDFYFISLKQPKEKNKVTIWLSDDILTSLEKRAKKNLLTLHEQVEDILRRSVVSSKKSTPYAPKVDDKFIELFSRARSGRKPKKKVKKN